MSKNTRFTIDTYKDYLTSDHVLELLQNKDSGPEMSFSDFEITIKRKKPKDQPVNLTALINEAVAKTELRIHTVFTNDDAVKEAQLKQLDLLKIQMAQAIYQQLEVDKTIKKVGSIKLETIKGLDAFKAVSKLDDAADAYLELQDAIVKQDNEKAQESANKLLESNIDVSNKIKKSNGGKDNWIVKAADATARAVIGFALPIVIYGVAGVGLGLALATITALTSGGTLPVISTSLLGGFAAAGGLYGLGKSIARMGSRKTLAHSWEQIGNDAKNDIKLGVGSLINLFGIHKEEVKDVVKDKVNDEFEGLVTNEQRKEFGGGMDSVSDLLKKNQ